MLFRSQKPASGEAIFLGFRNSSKTTSPVQAEKETAARTLFPFDGNLSYANTTEVTARAARVSPDVADGSARPLRAASSSRSPGR